MKKTYIFFSPHFDDVALSCGGLVNNLVTESDKVTVVTVFGGAVPLSKFSAFARHLHAKWRLPGERIVEFRQQEDRSAFACISPDIDVLHWDFLEAPYRRDIDGKNLYCSYQALRGPIVEFDRRLTSDILQRIEEYLKLESYSNQDVILYFPIGIGFHIDHQIVANAGRQLLVKGFQIFFYEEWPYVERFDVKKDTDSWSPFISPINLENKVNAASCYISQLHGLGESTKNLYQRLKTYSLKAGIKHKPSERLWNWQGEHSTENFISSGLPFKVRSHTLKLNEFNVFIDSLNWHDLDEILPVGSGLCLDAGSGDGRHCSLVENMGYQWLGMDRLNKGNGRIRCQADAVTLPFLNQSVNAVILWQILEYLYRPEQAIIEAVRVLKPGGCICGSVSFLEPLHGQTYYGISHLLLLKLLNEQGLADIEVIPGISGFSLSLWTWLNRFGGKRLAAFAIPITKLLFVPPASMRFFISWLSWRFGKGTAHGMEWISKRAPLEFAGHIMFVARKP